MIDVNNESLLSLAEARSAFPGGKRISAATIQRWRLNGVRGVILETVRIGGLRYTSREAVARFIAKQNADESPVATITQTQRRKQSEAAQHELSRMGIS